MRDATTGRLVWRSADWDVAEMFEKEVAGESANFITPQLPTQPLNPSNPRGDTEGDLAVSRGVQRDHLYLERGDEQLQVRPPPLTTPYRLLPPLSITLPDLHSVK